MVAAPGRLLGALATLALLAIAVPFGWPNPHGGAPSPAVVATPLPVGAVKYYIVGPPQGGQQEYLYEIAAKTLGNGRRYMEIFALNRGRLQADGGRLEDQTVLRTGWILVLPDDATGPDVHVGPLPSLGTQPTPTPSSAAAAPAPATQPLARPAVGRTWQDNAMRVVAIVACVALVAGAMRILRGGRVRPPTDSAAIGTAVMAPDVTLATVPQEVKPPVEALPRRRTKPVAPSPSQPDTEPPRREQSGAQSSDQLRPTTSEPPPRRPPYEAQVQHGDDVVRVRLVGASKGSAYVWLAPLDEPPAESMAIYVGGSSTGSLHLCLAAAPKVMTISGDPGARRRLARAIAEQFAAAGHSVIEVGDAGWPLPPLGVRFLERLDDLSAPEIAGAEHQMVICHIEPEKMADLLTLSNQYSESRIMVAVGDVRPAHWSVDVRQAAMTREQADATGGGGPAVQSRPRSVDPMPAE